MSTSALTPASSAELPPWAGCGAGSQPWPPKSKTARYESLDVWRGLACLMLVLYHGTFYADHQWRTFDPGTWSLGALALNAVTRLWVGVPLFFVVSGYCIAASVDSLRRKPYSLSSFLARRFRRIYPPLWAGCALAVAFVAIVSCWPAAAARCAQLPQLGELSWHAWVGNFSATESWLSGLRGNAPNYLMPNTWTLCYEEQFYCVTGLLLWLSARRFFTAAAVVSVGVLVARHALPAAGYAGTGLFCDGHWLMFAAGLLVYQRINYCTRRGVWAANAVWLGGIAYGLALRVRGADHAEQHLGEYIAVACAFAPLLIWLKRWDAQLASHRLAQPLHWCGRISYSIYLTHFPVVVFAASCLAAWGVHSDGAVVAVTLPLCVALTLPVGWLFHRFVERRFLNAPLAGKDGSPAAAATLVHSLEPLPSLEPLQPAL